MMHPGRIAPISPGRPPARVTLRRVTALFGPYQLHIAGIFVLVLAAALIGLLAPFYLRSLINQGLLKQDLGVVTHYTLLTIAVTLGGTALSLGYGYLSLLVG